LSEIFFAILYQKIDTTFFAGFQIAARQNVGAQISDNLTTPIRTSSPDLA
jgi:hypothetical protein